MCKPARVAIVAFLTTITGFALDARSVREASDGLSVEQANSIPAAFYGTWTPIERRTRAYLGPFFATVLIDRIDLQQNAGMLTIDYGSSFFTAGRSIDLNGTATPDSLVFAFKPGGLHEGGPALISSSKSTASWDGKVLTVNTTFLILREYAGPDSVKVTDKLSLNAAGQLTVDTQTNQGGDSIRTVLARAPGGDRAREADTSPQSGGPSELPAREWLGGYRFGMTPNQVRLITACPGRNYQNWNDSGTVSLTCHQFPVEGLKMAVRFLFSDRNELRSIEATDGPGSLSDSAARRETDAVLTFLTREVGGLASVELGDRPVTTDAIWQDLEHRQKPLNRTEDVTVTTAPRYAPVFAVARFELRGRSYGVSMRLVRSQ